MPPAPLVKPAQQAAHQVQPALQERLVQLEPLVRVSRVLLVLPALPVRTEPRVPQGLPDLTGLPVPLAFKAQQAQEQQAQRELPVRVSRALPAQLEWAPLEFKGQLERPAKTAPLALQGQEQLVRPERQEPG